MNVQADHHRHPIRRLHDGLLNYGPRRTIYRPGGDSLSCDYYRTGLQAAPVVPGNLIRAVTAASGGRVGSSTRRQKWRVYEERKALGRAARPV